MSSLDLSRSRDSFDEENESFSHDMPMMSALLPEVVKEAGFIASANGFRDFSVDVDVADVDRRSNGSDLVHNYVNAKIGQLDLHFCQVLYKFDSLDKSTLSVAEGEYLKVLQKHDDNMNEEWWLLERLPPTNKLTTDSSSASSSSSSAVAVADESCRGYVPANYVKYLTLVDLKCLIESIREATAQYSS